ncbi:hypothetical protein VPH35_126836 [Triticum aestivum]|uniref:disease resistance protein Pik-2 n=1 Tax=Triticum aestivum TaxID=4565 RepID=UPI001D032576|nr:disease resistance protein Pik-2-like [Triticum aestivum]
MAELVVGLSKSVVEGALTKVQSAIEDDAKLRQRAQRDLVSITLEFEMMQSFLNVANEESVKNTLVGTWVKHVRELAYDLEDCVENVVHLDSKPIFWRRLFQPCMALADCSLPLDQAVEELAELKGRAEELSKCYSRYSNITDSAGSKLIMMQQEGASSAIALDMLLKARDAAKGQKFLGDLTQLITQEGRPSNDLQVISVWGSAGNQGAISIMMKTYKDPEICHSYTHRAWVKLMHPFNPHDFIRNLMAQFFEHSFEEQGETTICVQLLTKMDEATQSQAHLFKKFEQLVTQERYLVVLEDLSNMVEWHAIRKFLPHRENGSCIIVSTQESEIASLCIGHTYEILELKQFSAEHSICALFNKGPQCDRDKGEETGVGKTAAQDWMTKHPLVGRESEMNNLRQYTSKARFYSFEVMSVWGIAGVGKSALLKNLLCDTVLNDCRLVEKTKPSIFDKYAWVDVSYPFNLREFSRSLLLSFHSQSLQANKDHDIDMMGSKNPILECRGILKQVRCLVVIDGIESTKEWDLIQAELVSGSSKNCIIIITAEESVARHCRGNKGELTFNVKGLQADDALALFKEEVTRKNKSFPSKYHDPDLEVQLHELTLKCGGLPKVIIAIAGLLAPLKPDTFKDTVRYLNDGFMDHIETNREFDCLSGLFGWMNSIILNPPDFLKPCIFYLAIFPPNQIIRRRRLIRRWIAEGYSRVLLEKHGEENAEKFFSQLLEKSIFQQVTQLSGTTLNDTRMSFYQVNGLIREYIVSRRMEENLVFELGGRSSVLTSQSTGRHLVISSRDTEKTVFESIDFSRLRSLTVFGQWESFFISKSMKMLRVLDLEDASGSVEYEDLKKMVKLLRRLKFLSLRGRPEINRLPSSLDHLRQLQTLDVRGTSTLTLPENITKLQKLQYIRAGSTDVPATTPSPNVSSSWLCKRHSLVGVKVPGGLGKLTALHTLGVINVAASGSKTFVKDLKKLTQLSKLGVSGINKKNSKEFFSAIEGHVHLESLSVQLDNETQGCCSRNRGNQGCLDGIPMPLALENLRSLKLYGLNDKLPEWGINQLSKLTKLDLEMATLMGNDMMKFLGELQQLCILRVKQLQDGTICFHVSVNNVVVHLFEKVKILQIACGSSSSSLHVSFGYKSMKKLELLKVDCHGGSPPYKLSGLENLKGLRQACSGG